MPEPEARKAYRCEWAKRKYAEDPESHRVYAREQYAKHAEKKRAYGKAYREKNREQIRAQQKQWRDANKALIKRNNLKLACFTPELLQEALEFQEHKCAICGDDLKTRPVKHTHSDHCHETKQPRGVLCTQCNTGLGLFKDDTERLEKAIAYLKSPPIPALKRKNHESD